MPPEPPETLKDRHGDDIHEGDWVTTRYPRGSRQGEVSLFYRWLLQCYLSIYPSIHLSLPYVYFSFLFFSFLYTESMNIASSPRLLSFCFPAGADILDFDVINYR